MARSWLEFFYQPAERLPLLGMIWLPSHQGPLKPRSTIMLWFWRGFRVSPWSASLSRRDARLTVAELPPRRSLGSLQSTAASAADKCTSDSCSIARNQTVFSMFSIGLLESDGVPFGSKSVGKYNTQYNTILSTNHHTFTVLNSSTLDKIYENAWLNVKLVIRFNKLFRANTTCK